MIDRGYRKRTALFLFETVCLAFWNTSSTVEGVFLSRRRKGVRAQALRDAVSAIVALLLGVCILL